MKRKCVECGHVFETGVIMIPEDKLCPKCKSESKIV
jgi:predicted Zn-ribbon and HTH transcriptional regulator